MSQREPEPLRVLVIIGTRPEAIKLAPVVRALERSRRFVPIVCSTGQHRQMLDQVLEVFSIVADYDLNLMQPNQTLPDLMSLLMQRITALLHSEKPDLVMVQGDTTTAMTAALAGFYAHIPVAHLEAGLRSNNMQSPWPEEMNRRVVTLLASIHLAPTDRAYRRLVDEGVSLSNVALTGNTVIDALLQTVTSLDTRSDLLHALRARFGYLNQGQRMILVTSHRRESWGTGLEHICGALQHVANTRDVQIVYPVHMNPNVREPVNRLLGGIPRIHLVEPLGYLDFVYLLRRCHFAVTDSGGIQEEAPSLSKPVLIIRDTTERPEGIEAGVSRLIGTNENSIVEAMIELLDDNTVYQSMARGANPYGDGRASERTVDFLETWCAQQSERRSEVSEKATR